MKKDSWDKYLSNIRVQEIEIAFKNLEPKGFDKGLELGAGNGFQSTLLIEYCNQLVSTELNEFRLIEKEIPDVEYKICDAEKIDTYFSNDQFDLVFSSNMFEHLPNPKDALHGIKKVLKDDGVVILLMPSVFWKFCHLFLFYPVKIFNTIRRKLFGKKTTKVQVEENTKKDDSNTYDNNLKLERRKRNPFWDKILMPVPHGVAQSNIEEFTKFKKSTWVKMFKECGYKVVDIKRGPITSGYGLNLPTSRKLLWKLGFTSEYIYYLKK